MQIPTENQSYDTTSNQGMEVHGQTHDAQATHQMSDYTRNQDFGDHAQNFKEKLLTQQHTIASEMKPIKFQQTNEKASSRPLSSLYVDDADEDDEDEDEHADSDRAGEEFARQQSMPVSCEENESADHTNDGQQMDVRDQMIDDELQRQ